MKKFAIIIATLVTTLAFAAEPAKTTTDAPVATPAKGEMLLAKKKADKKAADTKSPTKSTEASNTTKKTEAPKK